MPALAVADALRGRGASVTFLGARGRVEAELVPRAGYEIDLLDVRGIDRSSPLRAADAVRRAALALPAARRALRERDARAVLGGGGYVAGPAGLAAVGMRIPLVLSEADRHLGLANRLLARRARRICLAFAIPGLDGDRYIVTGRPIPAAITAADRGPARERFGVAAADRCLLVFGGSQGALSINRCALDAFVGGGGGPPAYPDRDFHVLHITGSRDHAEADARIEAAGPAPRYTLVEYEPTLADALAAADLVLARAGGSVFELAAAGRPAILVPYPYATARHQHANAEWMAAAGAAVVVEDEDLEPRALGELAGEILGDSERLRSMSADSAGLAMPDAAERIAAEILAAIRD